MANGGKRAARREEMRGVLKRWERSALPLSRFADREGIGRKTLYRWRRQLGVGGERLRLGRRRSSGSGSGSRGRSQSSATFTELSTTLRGAAAAAAVVFEVVLGGGTTVRVPAHFDPGSLRMLLGTLREC
jgi:transposase-like protein